MLNPSEVPRYRFEIWLGTRHIAVYGDALYARKVAERWIGIFHKQHASYVAAQVNFYGKAPECEIWQSGALLAGDVVSCVAYQRIYTFAVGKK